MVTTLLSDGYQGMPHNEHNVIPFYSRLNDSNGRMRYLSLSLSPYIYMNGDDVGPCRVKDNLDTLFRSHLNNVVNAVIRYLLLSVSCKWNEEGGNTQYFIY